MSVLPAIPLSVTDVKQLQSSKCRTLESYASFYSLRCQNRQRRRGDGLSAVVSGVGVAAPYFRAHTLLFKLSHIRPGRRPSRFSLLEYTRRGSSQVLVSELPRSNSALPHHISLRRVRLPSEVSSTEC
jgi:hypothetical protein